MHPHFGFSFVTPARELLWKVSSGPRSEKVARLCPKSTKTKWSSLFFSVYSSCSIASTKIGSVVDLPGLNPIEFSPIHSSQPGFNHPLPKLHSMDSIVVAFRVTT